MYMYLCITQCVWILVKARKGIRFSRARSIIGLKKSNISAENTLGPLGKKAIRTLYHKPAVQPQKKKKLNKAGSLENDHATKIRILINFVCFH